MRVYRQLERIRKFAVDEGQKALAQARDGEEAIRQQLAALQAEHAEQVRQVRDDTSMVQYFSQYLDLYRQRQQQYQQALQKAQEAVQQAEDRLRQAYGEKKKIEIIARRRQDEQLYARDREQQAKGDDQFLARFVHQRGHSR